MLGSSRAEGLSEGLEPIYADLPSAVHSKENALYLTSMMLRSLKTGQAFVNYVGAMGMVSALLSVPRVQSATLSDDEFAELRARVLAASPSAIDSMDAAREIDKREQRLIKQAADAKELAAKPKEPKSYRVAPPKAAAPEDPSTFRVRSPKRAKVRK
jgi:hypothetical protein